MDSYSEPITHPCVRCGACCGTYRVLFPLEDLEPSSFHVPKELTEKASTTERAMMGTLDPKPRCVASQGRIGHSVSCAIYSRRPGCCREYKASYEDGTRNPRCDEARKGKGLRPLRLSDWRTYFESLSL